MTHSKKTVLDFLTSHKEELQTSYPIKTIGLFGSFADGTNTKNSDIDIVYEIEDGSKFSMFEYLKLNQYLEENFHTKVDLVRESTIKDTLKPHIQKNIIYV